MAKYGQVASVPESVDLDLIDVLRDAVTEATEQLHQAKRRMSEQVQIAAQIHRRLLPSAVEHPKVLVDVRYLPVNMLSGDYFQVRFPEDPSLCYITMCHVTGEGIAPALLASRISSEARHYIEQKYCPSDMVHSLNCFFCEHFPSVEMQFSFMAARLDFDQRTMTYSGASHPGGMLLRPGEGLVCRLASQHCSIGVNSEILVPEPETTLAVKEGDRMLFFQRDAQERPMRRIANWVTANWQEWPWTLCHKDYLIC